MYVQDLNPAAENDPLVLTINSSLGQIIFVMTTEALGSQETQVLTALPATASLCGGEPPTLSALLKH